MCIEQPRFASVNIDIHSDAVGQVVPALKEMLLIVIHPAAGSSEPLLGKRVEESRTFESIRLMLADASFW